MPPVRKISLTPFMLMLLSGLLLAGCGDSNSQSTFNSQSGKHPANWVPTGHKTAAMANTETCAQCHGADFGGGVSKVACSQCHLGGPNSIHPTQWGTETVALHGSYVTGSGSSGCANASCHGANLDGVGGSGPSCTQCHLGGVNSKHPVNWGNYGYALHADYVKQNGTTGCANGSCHGANLDGVGGTGPSCTQCHLGGVNSKHPVAWNANFLLHADYVGANGTSSCRNAACHGANLQGVLLSGPACSLCHK